MTDIDDTIIESGEKPDDVWINWLSEKIRILKQYNIVWVPMSGVALVKLGPRILYRLPEDVLSHVIYYGGDGSQKYYYSFPKSCWKEDDKFKTTFSDAQAIAIIGYNEYKRALKNIYLESKDSEQIINKHLANGRSILEKTNIVFEPGILGEMKEILRSNGYDPELSETYFRGGSVSWMMLGDISADPYKTGNAIKIRKELISFALKRLVGNKGFGSIGKSSILIPFPGARGIKFVLEGNSKEKASRDLIEAEGIDGNKIIFVGNEIFEGGNDNMIRNIEGITLLSVGDRTDPGENVVFGGIGVEANNKWLNLVCDKLISGFEWEKILDSIKNSVIGL
jgi:hypothetical protein